MRATIAFAILIASLSVQTAQADGGHDNALEAATGQTSATAHEAAADGRTLLHEACEQGNYNRAIMLIDCGAQVGAKDAKGRTPLDLTAGRREPNAAFIAFAKSWQAYDAETDDAHTAAGRATLVIKNGSAESARVWIRGASHASITLKPGEKEELDIPAGEHFIYSEADSLNLMTAFKPLMLSNGTRFEYTLTGGKARISPISRR